MSDLLRAEAQAAFSRAPHWSVQAQLLHAIEASGALGGWGYASMAEYAAGELDLSGGQLVALQKLGDTMARYPGVAWEQVPRHRAGTLARILGLGGTPSVWGSRAAALDGKAWRETTRRALGMEEGWSTVTLRLSDGCKALLLAALEVEAEAQGIPAGRALAPEYTDRLLAPVLARAARQQLAEPVEP